MANPHVQRRKVAALGVEGLVDAVLFASECGDRPASRRRRRFELLSTA